MSDEQPKNKGGRPKGSRNKTNAQREAEVKASGLTPLDYMLSVLRADEPPDWIQKIPDPEAQSKAWLSWEEKRMWAAEKAAPYVHPKLASIENKVEVLNHEDALGDLE